MEEILYTSEDRISMLPDPMLLHILSFLDMKQVLKTSILSKRWQFLWTFLSTLTFNQNFPKERSRTHKFAAWVNKTLFGCQNAIIEKLYIRFEYSDCYSSDVDRWAQFASDKKVRDLSLYFPITEAYSLHPSLYCNKFLMNLSLEGCKLVHKLDLNWRCLKSLSMVYVKLSDDIIPKIFLGSPMLEYLNLEGCLGFISLDINSESLKKLVINKIFGFGIDELMLKISAPNLQYLYIFGYFYRIVNFQMLSVSSLSEVKLNFDYFFINSPNGYKKQSRYFIKLMESFRHVRELELSAQTIQVISLSLVEDKTLSLPLTNLTRLKVNAFVDDPVATGIVGLLIHSPNLEELVVIKPNYPRSQSFSVHQNQPQENWESKKFDLPHLMGVECHGFKELADIGESSHKLLQVILNNVEHLDWLVPQTSLMPCNSQSF